MESILAFTIQLVQETGELLLDYYQSKALQTARKSDRSIVTEADVAADRFIANAIHRQYPQDILISEESNNTLPACAHGGAPSTIWVIDPLDGTTNFSLRLPIWGVLATRLVDGWPQLTTLYFPMIHELYTAELRQGASLNGEPLLAQSPLPGQQLSFFACCSRTFRNYQVSIPYKIRIFGSTAYSFCMVARGLAAIGFEATPKLWDIAGAWLLVQEAGGSIEIFDGQQPFPVQPGMPYEAINFPTLAATTSTGIARARRQILPIPAVSKPDGLADN